MITDESDDKLKKLTDFRSLVITSIVSALALVVGLFWNEAIKATIDQIVPQGEGLFYKFLAAILVTIIVVVIIYIVMHSQRVAEKRLGELKRIREEKLNKMNNIKDVD